MSEPFVVTSRRDETRCLTIVKLSRGTESVECYVTDEVVVDSAYPNALAADVMQLLVDAWDTKYGKRLAAYVDASANYTWRIHDEDYVDGEVIEEEERRAIDAPRKAIEGRRN